MRKKPIPNRLGLTNDSPRIFNIDSKLTPQNPIVMVVNGQRVSKSVQTWIQEDPVRVWMKLYFPPEYFKTYRVKSCQEQKISLARNSLTLLRTAIKKVRPDLYDSVNQRRSRRYRAKTPRKLVPYEKAPDQKVPGSGQ